MSALVIFRRILNLHQRKFWHSWEVRWSCLYEDVVGFPLLTENALVIKEQSSKVQFLRSLNCFCFFLSRIGSARRIHWRLLSPYWFRYIFLRILSYEVFMKRTVVLKMSRTLRGTAEVPRRSGPGFKSRTGLNFPFSGLLFTTAQVVFITARIAFIFTSLSAVQIYDFHILTFV